MGKGLEFGFRSRLGIGVQLQVEGLWGRGSGFSYGFRDYGL